MLTRLWLLSVICITGYTSVLAKTWNCPTGLGSNIAACDVPHPREGWATWQAQLDARCESMPVHVESAASTYDGFLLRAQRENLGSDKVAARFVLPREPEQMVKWLKELEGSRNWAISFANVEVENDFRAEATSWTLASFAGQWAAHGVQAALTKLHTAAVIEANSSWLNLCAYSGTCTVPFPTQFVALGVSAPAWAWALAAAGVAYAGTKLYQHLTKTPIPTSAVIYVAMIDRTKDGEWYTDLFQVPQDTANRISQFVEQGPNN